MAAQPKVAASTIPKNPIFESETLARRFFVVTANPLSLWSQTFPQSSNEVKKVLTNYVKKQPQFNWMTQLSYRVDQNALIDLKDAFSRYRSGKSDHPRFNRQRDGQSFTVDSSSGKVLLAAGNTIKIPTLGTFRLHEPLECSVVSQTFTKRMGLKPRPYRTALIASVKIFESVDL